MEGEFCLLGFGYLQRVADIQRLDDLPRPVCSGWAVLLALMISICRPIANRADGKPGPLHPRCGHHGNRHPNARRARKSRSGTIGPTAGPAPPCPPS